LSEEHDVAPQAVPEASGRQVPGDVVSVQLTHVPAHSVSQQTPCAPQTPLAHWVVAEQAVPGVSFVWQVAFAAQ
jgi:hypothetical protein